MGIFALVCWWHNSSTSPNEVFNRPINVDTIIAWNGWDTL